MAKVTKAIPWFPVVLLVLGILWILERYAVTDLPLAAILLVVISLVWLYNHYNK